MFLCLRMHLWKPNWSSQAPRARTRDTYHNTTHTTHTIYYNTTHMPQYIPPARTTQQKAAKHATRRNAAGPAHMRSGGWLGPPSGPSTAGRLAEEEDAAPAELPLRGRLAPVDIGSPFPVSESRVSCVACVTSMACGERQGAWWGGGWTSVLPTQETGVWPFQHRG